LIATHIDGLNDKNACVPRPGRLDSLLGLIDLYTLGFARHPGAQTDTLHTKFRAEVEARCVPDIVPANRESLDPATWALKTATVRAEKGKPVVSTWERSLSPKERLDDGRPA